MQKQFSQMSETERKVWLLEFQPWYAQSLPEIEKASGIGVDERKKIEQGLNLINVFPYCHSFVSESLRFKDYKSRKKVLRRFADIVAKDAQKQIGMDAIVDLTNPDLLKPHVGRPTKEEQAARQIKEEKDRKENEEKDKTLFGPMSDIPTVEPAAPETVSGSVQGGSLLHLDQLRWLMSPELQEAVGTVRTLRATAAEAATKAKQMAEDGRKAEDIVPYTEKAIRDTEAYEKIYERVDNEMAVVYVRLKEDTAYNADMQKRGVDIQQLRTQLRPYFDKQPDKEGFKQRVINDIKASDPAQAAQREADEKKKKQATAIIKYIIRKDKQNTAKRIEGLKKRYAELVALIGEEEAKVYKPVVDAAVADYEQSHKLMN